MAQITRVQETISALRKLKDKAPKAVTAFNVGYDKPYALKIHEDLEMFHSNGQAKYLEQPARQLRTELARMIKEELRKGATMEQALYRTGLYLQHESQKLVPVRTGALRDSAYTRVV